MCRKMWPNTRIPTTTKMVAIGVAFFLFWLKLPKVGVHASIEGEMMSAWADKFGEELWDLAEKMTKVQDIKGKYKQYNARVERKDGDQLMEDIAKNVGRMLSSKMVAITNIINKAEEASEAFDFNETSAETFQYYSSKYSPIDGVDYDPEELWPPGIIQNNDTYRPMYFYQDTHFYDIPVNTTHSSVQVPSNVYDLSTPVLETLMWSEALDEVFINNYNSDPALSWQYFGSHTGILRHYPAMAWNRNDVDVYDCRKRSWYIETATCSKDVVILLDNSGSMTGYRNYIAQLTIKSLLDTFSNNDFVNVYNFSAEVDNIVPCFGEKLVQATPENIKVFNEAVRKVAPEGYADVRKALIKAFKLLERYREVRGCAEQGCNQAIMLITDGVPGNMTDIFDTYNNFENGTQKPVRMFTYLLGKEVTKVREIQWMACLNRGYYSHIQTLDQVQEEVLKYVSVIATPLILQGVEHPPTWTHAFLDLNWEPDADSSTFDPPRLMIAVGAPAFDRKYRNNNDTKGARLLGVAGTDISVEDLDKLTLPYKLGVNGYSFIVSNNGYVLLHPDLRPVYKELLKDNYNSIDLVEIEQVDDDNQTVRDPDPIILELRQKMVNSERGKMLGVPVIFHYDNMRRVSLEKQDYYFSALPNTPFSLGLALPSEYGMTWIKVGDEVRRNQHLSVNISHYFVGDNWKIHPGWVYCKYHYLEGHEFKTPEAEWSHFLAKMQKDDWEWHEQYEFDADEDEDLDLKLLDQNAYYCNKELVQLLVFDAKVTNESYQSWKFVDDVERAIVEKYNASLRFVATMSGLTRWQFIFGEVEVENDREFGDYHTKAIDETWYRAAVLQHRIDPQSFFYSVQHSEDEKEEGVLKVYASMAIFPRDGGMEAPSCVVGFQLSQPAMTERFMDIASKSNCEDCIRTCDDIEVDCYVIDSNGYIVIAENSTYIGAFLGEVEGEVIKAMVDTGIFITKTVYDYQALCMRMVPVSNDGHLLLTPFKLLILGAQFLISELFSFLSRMQLLAHGIPLDELYDDFDVEEDYPGMVGRKPTDRKPKDEEDEDSYFLKPREIKLEPFYYACDNASTLYVINNDNEKINSYYHETSSEMSKPYFIKRVPRSNLLVVIINSTYVANDPNYKETTEPITVSYNVEFPCHKLSLNDLARRRLEECYTEHPDEEEFAVCGRGHLMQPQHLALGITVIILNLVRRFI